MTTAVGSELAMNGHKLRAHDGPQVSARATRSLTTATRVSVVIPAKNEAKNIPWVLLRMPSFVDEVLLVDGDSTDGTVALATAVWPSIQVVSDPGGGKGAALRAGFAAASGDYIVMLDADGSMDPAEMQRYLALLDAGFDVVKGSRFANGGGSTDITPMRRMGNSALRALVNRAYGTHFSDLCYGYCAFKRSCLPALCLVTDGFEIETELTINAVAAGLRICEVPSSESPRGHGHSNLNAFRDGKRVLRTLIGGRVRLEHRPRLERDRLHDIAVEPLLPAALVSCQE